MAETMLMIGAPTRRRMAKGEHREAKFYYVGVNPLADGIAPKIGESVAWCPSYSSLDLTADTMASEVTEVKADWIGGSQPGSDGNGTSTTAWMVYVTAKGGDEDDGGGGGTANTPENLAKRVKKAYSLKEVFLDPIWWGMLKADKKMAGVEPIKTIKKSSSKKEFEYFSYILRNDGGELKEGDLYFKNASIAGRKRREIDVSTTTPVWGDIVIEDSPQNVGSIPQQGTTSIKLSPYGAATGNDQINPEDGPHDDNIDFAGKKVHVVLYTCTFYVKAKTYDSFLDWWGISPASGAFSKLCEPNYGGDGSKEHLWRAVDVKLNKVKDTNRDSWVEITRVCEAAPWVDGEQWRWNLNKSISGEWTW